jgi:uncharacterized protein
MSLSQPNIQQQEDRAIWTTRDTIIGVLLTLIPLSIIDLSSHFSSSSSSNTNTGVSPSLDGAYAVATFITTLILEGIFVVAPLYYALRRGGKNGLVSLGVRKTDLRRAVIASLLAIIGVTVLIFIYGIIGSYINPNIQTNADQLKNSLHDLPLTLRATLAGSVIIAPVCEELFFRGFLLQGLRAHMSNNWSAVVSSAIFALIHFDGGSFTPLFILGLALAVLRIVTGSIWPCVALHTLNNLITSLSLLS